ncbi:hypothetical protein Tco_1474184 [Tanacetum coccineum]
MTEGLSSRMLMEHRDAHGQSVFNSRAWRRLFDIRGPLLGGVRRRMSWREFILALGLHIGEEMQTAGFGLYWPNSARQIPKKGDLSAYWIGISSVGDFLGIPPSYTLIRDPILRLCHRLIACSIAGRSKAPEKGGSKGMTVIVRDLSVIDMSELVRLQICIELDDTWAWVALGPERQPDSMVGAPEAIEDALVADEGAPAVPTPVQAP